MAMRASLLFPARSIWTVDDLERLPDDGNRYEILHGELLVTPLPSNGHQGIAFRLARILGNWCVDHTGWAVRTPGGVYVGETTWLEPDVAVYPAPEFANLSWREMPPPLLVAEVLSKSTRTRDRHRKRPAYLAHGVGEVWIIDQASRTIEKWTSASEFPEVHPSGIAWCPDTNLPACVVTDGALFGARS